jgi:diguanylate cyclase (GGDEF)-like protein
LATIAEPINALIVDANGIDAERSRMELRRALPSGEFPIAADWNELQALLRTFAPDVVISELFFPDFDGYAVQRVVRESFPDVPLIFVSTASVEDFHGSAESVVADYIPKASLYRLPASVAAVVREARERQQVRLTAGTSGVRSRLHAQRLEAIWRVVNDPDRSTDELDAVLTEATSKIGHGMPAFAMVGHIEGDEFVIDTVAGDLGAANDEARRLLRPGMRGLANDVILARDVAAGRTTSWDDIDAFPHPPAYSRAAGLRSQISTQFLVGGVAYMLTLGSIDVPFAMPFGPEDYAYIEVVGSIVARRLERERHHDSLLAAERGSHRHAERIDVLWRIANSTSMRSDELIAALLVEGSAAMRPGIPYAGTLGHIDGDDFVLDAVGGEGGPPDGAPRRMLYPGMRSPRRLSQVARDLTVGRTQSWDDCQALPDLPSGTRALGIRSQITTQFVANETIYVLSFGTLQPPSPNVLAFASEDYEYIEALASVLARQLELEAMEKSLRDAEARTERQTQRLDAMWRVVNDPVLRGAALIPAILNEAANALGGECRYACVLRHAEGSQYVIDAVAGELGPATSPARHLLKAGVRIDASETVPHDIGLRRTRSFPDLQAVPEVPARVREVGWRSVIATSFEAAGSIYELTFGSLETRTTTPFSTEDEKYLEVLASVLARHIDLDVMQHSLGQAESRARQHAERLEALWRVANNPSLHGQDLVLAMLRHGAAAIRVDQEFRGVLSRFEGDEAVVIGLGIDPDRPAPTPRALEFGRRRLLADMLIPAAGRTQGWDDLMALGDQVPSGLAALGWRAVIATTFDAGGARYVLEFGSPEPTRIAFGDDDLGYLEVLASSFASRLHVDDLEDSLRLAEERSRQHAERLESLWQIINSSNLRDDELMLAMLKQACSAIQSGQEYAAILVHVEGDDTVIDAVACPPGVSEADLKIKVGDIIPLGTTAFGRVLAEGGGTRSWDDAQTTAYSTAETRRRGTRSLIISTFTAGTRTWGLAFTSTRTARRPLGPQDHAYIDVVASFFANHLQQRWQYDRIQYQQSHDVLTGQLNRSTFRSQARTAARTLERYAVVMIDVDALHEVNESYGHIIGDAVLVEVGNALAQRRTGDEIVGRLGGDVFGIFIPEPRSAADLFARVHAFSDVFAHPFSTGDRDGREFIARSACIGVASAPDDGTEFESILLRADAALFTAQERGHGSTVFYVAGMEAEAQRRAALHNELREALAADQFTLHVQPHVELATGRITGGEALIRWNHPTRGLVAPAHFIPFAEETGIITSIDAWVMKNALAMATDLGAQRPDFRLYFNLSGRQAGDPKVVRAFIDAARNGAPLRNVGVEITETDAMRDVASTRRVCRALRRLDVRVAIDDFGTGYSSLSSLKRLPVDIVKIDRAFISGVLSDRHDETITETIISIADHFGFDTLAEGAEQQAELDWLRQRTCRYVQGYAVCHPLPLDEFKRWLHEREAPSS